MSVLFGRNVNNIALVFKSKLKMRLLVIVDGDRRRAISTIEWHVTDHQKNFRFVAYGDGIY